MKKQNNFAKFNIFPAPAGAKGGWGEGHSTNIGASPYAGVYTPYRGWGNRLSLRRATTLRWVIYPLQGLGGNRLSLRRGEPLRWGI